MSEDLNNQDVETLMKEGKEALENDDLEKADKLLHQALELDPENADLHVDIGNLFHKLKKTFKAREHFQKASELKPDSFRPWHSLGLLERERGNIKTAIGYFEKALSIKPDMYASLNSLGNCYLDLKDLEKAEYYYLKAVKINPLPVQALFGLALIYKNTQRNEEIVSILKPFLETEKKCRKEVLTLLCSAYCDLGKYEEALMLCDISLEEFSKVDDQAEFMRNKGIIYSRQQKPEKACEFYQHAAELSPDNIRNWIDLLLESNDIADREKTFFYVNLALFHHPRDPQLLFTIGTIYNYSHDRKTAISFIEKAIEADPSFIEAKATLAFFYFKNEQPLKALDLAIETSKRLSDLTNQRLSFYVDDLGEHLKSIGKFELGNQYIKRYLEINLEN